ncbi:non-ribosomal peptide synthetase, partial [Streptomyces spectabilis]
MTASGPGAPESSAEFPLTQQQWAVLTSQRLHPDSDAYHVPIGYRLTGPLDEAALERALRRVLERHPVLRVALHDGADGLLRQRVNGVPDRVLATHAVTADETDARVAAAVAAPFAAEATCRLRADLFRLAPEEAILVLVFDHLVVDAPSVAVIADELARAYAEFRAGVEPGPVAPESGYFAYARDQEDFFLGAEAARLGDFWDGYLSGLAAPAVPGRASGAGRTASLPVRVADGLTVSAERAGVTPAALLMAALSLTTQLCFRVTDTVISYPAVDWRRMEYEPVVGLFTDMPAFRCPPHDRTSLQEYVRTVHADLLECLGHQGAPLAKLRARLRAADPRGDGTPPVMLSVNNVPGTGLRLPGLTEEWLGLRPAHPKTGLALSVFFRDTGVEARLDFDPGHHDEAAARRFATAFEQVLGQAVAGWDGPAAAVELAGAADRSLVLDMWNPPAPAAPEWTVPGLFVARAARTPDAVALVARGQETTYGRLEADSRLLAARLAALSLPAGSVVALCLPRSAAFVTAALAVLRSGLALLPVDMEQPPGRRAFLLADAGVAAAIVAGPEGPEGLKGTDAATGPLPVVDLSQPADPLPGYADAEPAPDHPAYLITTSGSTGLPKTVVVPHRAIANHVRWKASEFGFDAEDRFYFKTPPVFDASLWEYLLPLTIGARTVVAPHGAQRDPALLLAEMRRYRVSVVQFVPTVLKAVLAEKAVPTEKAVPPARPVTTVPGLSQCTALRWIFSGGEPLETSVAARVRAATGARLVNLYGPTEATIDATFHVCDPDEQDRDGFVPIGRPVGGGQAYVLGEGGQPLPPGLTGELHIGGLPLATGYAHRRQLTEERFAPHPFAAVPGQVLYRTGDLARFREDGALEFRGREDAEAKVRGMRVDLAGIGALLGELAGVRDAVVTVLPGRDDALAAYVVADPGVPDAALRAHLADRLPRELVPAAVVRLDALPVTASGKTDVRA